MTSQAIVAEYPRGLVLSRDLESQGDRWSLYAPASREDYLPIVPGAYVLQSHWASLTDWQQFDLRMRAIALTRRSRFPVIGLAGASLYGLPLVAPYPKRLEVATTFSATAKHRFVREVSFPRIPAVEYRDGIPVAPLPDVLADLALRASASQAVTALDAAVRDGLCTKDDVLHALETRERVYGVARAKRRIDFADARAQLPGESVSRVLMAELRFALPELQVPLTLDAGKAFLDFGWRLRNGTLIGGEFDGRSKYEREEYLRGLRTADAVMREKQRETMIASRGVRILRWTWSDLQDRARFAAILRAGGVPPSSDRALSL